MNNEEQEISMAFKQTFSSEPAKVVLEHLSKICLANPQAPLFDVNSQRQTDFNLGNKNVYDYIINQIEAKIEKTDDCQTEEPEQKGI